jgi:hypothetical protein
MQATTLRRTALCRSLLAIRETGQLPCQTAAERRQAREAAEQQIAQWAKGWPHRRQACQTIRERDDLLGYGTPPSTVFVERRLLALRQRDGQRIGKSHRIEDAGIHALAARRAVHVGRVAGQKHTAGTIDVRHAVMHAKARTPDDLAHSGAVVQRAPSVQQRLHIRCARLLGRFVDSGYYAVYAFRQGCHYYQTGRREVRITSSDGTRPSSRTSANTKDSP